MSAITEKIQTILRSRISRAGPGSESVEEMTENRIKLRDILSDQHRVMYYTVTISTLHPLQIPGYNEKINHQLRKLLQHCLLGRNSGE